MRHETSDYISSVGLYRLRNIPEARRVVEFATKYPFAVASRILEFDETLQNINTLLERDNTLRKTIPAVENFYKIFGKDYILTTFGDMVGMYKNFTKTGDYEDFVPLMQQTLQALPELLPKNTKVRSEGIVISELIFNTYNQYLARELAIDDTRILTSFRNAFFAVLSANQYLAALHLVENWEGKNKYPHTYEAALKETRTYRKLANNHSPLVRDLMSKRPLTPKEELAQFIAIKLRSFSYLKNAQNGTQAYAVYKELRMLTNPVALDLDETIVYGQDREHIHPQANTAIDAIRNFGTVVFYTSGSGWLLTKLQLEKHKLWRSDTVLLTRDTTDAFSTLQRYYVQPEHAGVKALRDAFINYLRNSRNTAIGEIDLSVSKREIGIIFGEIIPLIDNDPSNIDHNPSVFGIRCESFCPGAKRLPFEGGEPLLSAVNAANRWYKYML